VPVVTANGIAIYHERRGDGPRLLFVNGSGATLAMVAPSIDRYAAHFDVLAHDQRGLGRTEIPPGPYEMADYAADVAALLDAVGWDSCRVVGGSFGGMVAQEFAVTWPGRVERLALLCTSPGGAYASFPLHTVVEASPAEVAARSALLMDTRFTPEWLATHDDDRALIEMTGAALGPTSTGEVRRGELAQLDARSRFDCLDRLGAITCPTLVAAGRYDGIAPVVNSEVIAARIPDAELHVYDGGHTFTMQDPQAMPDVLAFLAADD
jgi:pimeloyl-ACP methyl ester carboxylesterase